MSKKRPHRPSPLPIEEKLEEVEIQPIRISDEAQGTFWLVLAFIVLVSTLSFAYAPESENWLGKTGYWIGKSCFSLLGVGAYAACCCMAWIGWQLFLHRPIYAISSTVGYVALAIIASNLILCMAEESLPFLTNWLGETFVSQMWHKKLRYHLGGAPLFFLYRDLPHYSLVQLFNAMGVALIALALLGYSLLRLCGSSPSELRDQLLLFYHKVVASLARPTATPEEITPLPSPPRITPSLPSQERIALPTRRRAQRMLGTSFPKDDDIVPAVREFEVMALQEIAPPTRPQPLARTTSDDYTLPPAELLTQPPPIDSDFLTEELRRQADILEETLLNFGIEAKVGTINCGPTITSFEVHPAVGVKVQRIKTLENDIALNLEAKSIRIIAPIPGKAAVGIEVPNPVAQEVGFYELLAAYQNGSKRYHIPLLLGKAVNGDMVMSDLAKMPHLIIAGATGSGKSVCINTIVMSIVLNARPDEIKLVMVDPKKVELNAYSRLPHMLAPVITEAHGACAALQWLVKEMERRYELLKLIGLRNIDSFNHRTRDLEREASLDREVPERLPYIVCIIDELADLMMVSSNDIETFIARIAQMARAIGIHLILATQRPSREVITGLIKANFPTRISFKVASRVNSQIILDEVGAESLLGNGDMLFLPPGTSQLMRAQGAYIRDTDINRVIDHICSQAPPNYLIRSFDAMDYQGRDGSNGEGGALDPLFEEAKKVILSTGNASTTFLQRKLKLGYPKAASLMDQLEKQGVVGPADGSRPRKILAGYGSQTPDDLMDDEDADSELL